jgi:hypothetical protein
MLQRTQGSPLDPVSGCVRLSLWRLCPCATQLPMPQGPPKAPPRPYAIIKTVCCDYVFFGAPFLLLGPRPPSHNPLKMASRCVMMPGATGALRPIMPLLFLPSSCGLAPPLVGQRSAKISGQKSDALGSLQEHVPAQFEARSVYIAQKRTICGIFPWDC